MICCCTFYFRVILLLLICTWYAFGIEGVAILAATATFAATRPHRG